MNKIFIWLRAIISQSLGFVQRIFGIQPLPISILCYHGFGKNEYVYDISVRAFEDQMKYLSEHANFVSLHDIDLYLKGRRELPKNAVAITFDDGYKSLLKITKVVDKYNIHPTLFALSHPQSANRDELANAHPLLSYPELKKLQKSGWEVGSHTATHPSLMSLGNSELASEIVGSKKELQTGLGSKIRYFAYPKGGYTSRAREIVKKAGYSMAVSMDDTPISSTCDPFIVSRIGINASHSLGEFKILQTPWVNSIRQMIKGKHDKI